MNTLNNITLNSLYSKATLSLLGVFSFGVMAQAQFNSSDGLISTSNFSDLNPKEEVLMTSDGDRSVFQPNESNCALKLLLQRTWDVKLVKGNPGTCNLSLDLTQVRGFTDANQIHLVIDEEKNGFGDSDLISGTVSGSKITFFGVQLIHNSRISFGEGVSAYYAIASGDFNSNIWSTTPVGPAVISPVFCEKVAMVIPAGRSVSLSTNNVHVGNLIIETGGTLNTTFPRDNLNFYIHGDFVNNGTFGYAHGNFHFAGEKLQFIKGNAFNMGLTTINNPEGVSIDCPELTITNGVMFSNGDLFTNNALTLQSTASRTAYIGNLGGSQVHGEVTVQRYHTASTGWFMMGSAVQGSSIADWNDDLVTTGFTGSDFPLNSFNNIQYYDESVPGSKDVGYVGVANITDNIIPKAGYFVYASAGVQQVDVTGEIYQGYQELPVTFSNGGTNSSDGFCFVSNPYPSAIDWNSPNWTKVNMANAVYVFNAATGTYATYINGIRNNGGSNIIASSQGFQVKARGSNPVLAVTEGVKVKSSGVFKSNEEAETIAIQLEWNGLNDAFTLVNDKQSGMEYNSEKDAERMPKLPEFPAVSVRLQNEDYAIKSINLSRNETAIPLALYLPESGDFTISLGENKLQGNQVVWLRDKHLSMTYNLSEMQSVRFTDNTEIENRFELIFSSDEQPSIINQAELSVQIDNLQNTLKLVNHQTQGPVLVSIWNALGQQLIETAALQAGELRLIPIDHIRGQFIVNIMDPVSGKSKTKNFIR